MATENNITDGSTLASESLDGPSPAMDAAWELPAEVSDTERIDAPVAEVVETPEAPESLITEMPFTLPEALRPPPPVTEGGLSLDEQASLQAELNQLRQQQSETLQIQTQNRAITAISDKTQELMSLYNMDEISARVAATEIIKERQLGEDAVAQERQTSQSEVNRRNAARNVGLEFNVDPSALMDLDSTDAMRREARWISYVAKNDTRVANVERKLVPDQKFVDGGMGAESVNSGNIDALYMGWEQAHPNQDGNPYESRYRTLLNR